MTVRFEPRGRCLACSQVLGSEAELLDVRERLEFSHAGNVTLTECGAAVVHELAESRRELAEARLALTRARELLQQGTTQPKVMTWWLTDVRSFLTPPVPRDTTKP